SLILSSSSDISDHRLPQWSHREAMSQMIYIISGKLNNGRTPDRFIMLSLICKQKVDGLPAAIGSSRLHVIGDSRTMMT
nr:hypothetical protein [Candidatus Njordarchaeota archaeon]